MSKYSHEEQANIVGMAAELEAAIIFENAEIPRLEAERFRSQPAAPQLASVPEPSVPEPKYIKHVPPKPQAKSFPNWLSEKTKKPNALIWLIAMMAQAVIIVPFCLSAASALSGRKPNVAAYIIFGIIALVSAGIAGFTLYKFINYKKAHNKYFADVKNSEEYKNECIAAAQATEQKNQEIKANYEAQLKTAQSEYEAKVKSTKEEYDAALANYNDVVIPTYKNELAVWQGKKEEMIALVKKDLAENTEALEELYSSTKLIPSSYRDVERLTWIYEDMSTSEHDIERAIDLLNNKEIKDELVNIQVHVDDMRRDMRDGFMGVYSAIQEGNAIQSDMLDNLDKIRSSARTGNFLSVGGLIQNHKRNKTLSELNSKFK